MTIPRMVWLVAVSLSFGAAATAEDAAADESFSRNRLGVFVGGTYGGDSDGDGKQEAASTVGIEYERRLTRLVGIGFLTELTTAERRHHVGFMPVSFRPTPETKFIVAPGWELTEANRSSDGEFKAGLRLGFGYEIEVLPRQTVEPEVAVDFVEGETLVVLGVTIGWDL